MGVLGTLDPKAQKPNLGPNGLNAAGPNGGTPPAGGASSGGAGAAGAGGGQGGLAIQGSAAIIAPVSAFPGGVPNNALVLLPLPQPTKELMDQLAKGPLTVTPDQMWKLLGFNGPAVQVQDDQGRPIAIGLDDLIGGLQKHWDDGPDDLNRGRILAQELLKYGRVEKAEGVLSKLVARGGTGEDWLALGVAQLTQEKLDKAEGTLRGAQNLMPDNPYPSLHLAKLAKARKNPAEARSMAQRAISLDTNCVDAWAYFFQSVREADGEDKAIAAVEELANATVNQKSVAPYVAVQGFYANDEATRDKALLWAEKAVGRNADDPLAILCLSALYGQKGDLDGVIKLLQPHEAKMSRDVRLANNYFEALFQARQIEKVTKLLNALAASPNREVKQFAIERSRFVAQFLQQQQQQLAGTQKKS
jgi:tetratricopeptide (TPR) repeat protein